MQYAPPIQLLLLVAEYGEVRVSELLAKAKELGYPNQQELLLDLKLAKLHGLLDGDDGVVKITERGKEELARFLNELGS